MRRKELLVPGVPDRATILASKLSSSALACAAASGADCESSGAETVVVNFKRKQTANFIVFFQLPAQIGNGGSETAQLIKRLDDAAAQRASLDDLLFIFDLKGELCN